MRFTRKNLIKRLQYRINAWEKELNFYKKIRVSYHQLEEKKTKAKINEFEWLIWELENWEELDL